MNCREDEANTCWDSSSTENSSEGSDERYGCCPVLNECCEARCCFPSDGGRIPHARTNVSLNKVCEKSYKIKKLATRIHSSVSRAIISQLEDLFYSFKPIVDTSDIKINSVVSENLKKLERDLSKSVSEALFNISNGSQKIVRQNSELLLKKQEALSLEVSKEAEKYVEDLIGLGDPDKISDAVNDKVNGLMPTIMNMFHKMKVLNVPTFSDSSNKENEEIQELLNEQSKINNSSLNTLFSDMESFVAKGLSKQSKNRTKVVRELMLKKIRSAFLQIHQSMSLMEDEIDELVQIVSPGRPSLQAQPKPKKKTFEMSELNGLFGAPSTSSM